MVRLGRDSSEITPAGTYGETASSNDPRYPAANGTSPLPFLPFGAEVRAFVSVATPHAARGHVSTLRLISGDTRVSSMHMLGSSCTGADVFFWPFTCRPATMHSVKKWPLRVYGYALAWARGRSDLAENPRSRGSVGPVLMAHGIHHRCAFVHTQCEYKYAAPRGGNAEVHHVKPLWPRRHRARGRGNGVQDAPTWARHTPYWLQHTKSASRERPGGICPAAREPSEAPVIFIESRRPGAARSPRLFDVSFGGISPSAALTMRPLHAFSFSASAQVPAAE